MAVCGPGRPRRWPESSFSRPCPRASARTRDEAAAAGRREPRGARSGRPPPSRVRRLPGAAASRAAAPTRIPDIGDRLHRRIPATSRQVLAVYGDGADSAESTAVLYTRRGPVWERVRRWPAHNGKKGWTPDHRLGDNRSPVGVFTLTAAAASWTIPGPDCRTPARRTMRRRAGGTRRTGTTSTTSSPSTTTVSRAPRPTTASSPGARRRAVGSGCTWITATGRPPASACPRRRWSFCCSRSTRSTTPWW